MRAVRNGFTLIELLVVLVVLGILSGIAIAKFVNTKESAYIASMKADLRNFALYEQNYLMDSQGSYFSSTGGGNSKLGGVFPCRNAAAAFRASTAS